MPARDFYVPFGTHTLGGPLQHGPKNMGKNKGGLVKMKIIKNIRSFRDSNWSTVNKAAKKIFNSCLVFLRKYTFLAIILVILAIIVFKWLNLNLNFRKMIYTFAQAKGIPLESTTIPVELYQMTSSGNGDRELTNEKMSAILPIGGEQKLYFGLRNVKENSASYKSPVLQIQFQKKDLDAGKLVVENEKTRLQGGWDQLEPPGRYTRVMNDLQSLPLLIKCPITPIFLTIKKPGKYHVRYIISSLQDEAPVEGEFILEGI